MWWRAIIAGLVVAGVSELADRYPRLSVLLLTLPYGQTITTLMLQHGWLANARTRADWSPIFVPLAFSQALMTEFLGRLCAGHAPRKPE